MMCTLSLSSGSARFFAYIEIVLKSRDLSEEYTSACRLFGLMFSSIFAKASSQFWKRVSMAV